MMREGAVVIASAGRDSGGCFVVIGFDEGGRALICDGKSRRLTRPKAKNPKHLTPTGEYAPDGLRSDRALRKFLSACRRNMEG